MKTLLQKSTSSSLVVKLTLVFFIALFSGMNAYAQPTVLGTQVANGSYTTYDLVTRGGGVRFVRINATSGAATGLRNWEFATGSVGGGVSYTTNWRPYTSGQTISGYNTYIDPTSILASARYNTSSGGQSGLLPAVVSGSYYTFLVGGNSAANNFMSVLSTTYNPKNITAASQAPVAASVGVGQPVVVTTTISAALTSPETVYLRYSNDGFSTSTIIPFSTAGTSLTATIPGAFNTASANISYYIFSSNTATTPSVTQADYFTLNLYNSSGQNASGGGTNYSYTVGATVPTYTWNQSGTASWATPANWTPTRTTPGVLDNLVFSNGATTTATGIPVETIGSLTVSANTTVNLQPAGANALTISNGAAGADLSVASGSALNANGANALALTLASGATGSISGTMDFSTSTNTLIVTDASALTFNSGSSFTQNTGNTGAVFGTSGTANVIIFASGSKFEQFAGSSPFGLTQPASRITFQTGSLFKLSVAQSPGFTGRTYANFEYNAAGVSSPTGGTAVSIDNLTISLGTFNFNMTAVSSIKGNISVANGAALTFTPASATVTNLNGTGVQSITTTGTGTISVASAGNLTVVSGSTADIGTSVITGAGTFTVATGATFRTGNTAGIASSGATGSIQTTTRSFNAGANYVYNGAANQITGTGLPATVSTLTINNTGTNPTNVVTLTNAVTTTATAGSLTLTAGRLDLNSKTLTIPTAGNVVATSGDFTATAGPLAFAGTGTTTGTMNIPTTTLAGTVTFNTGANIVTSLQINTGGAVQTPPTYGAASTLIYNSGTTYGRFNEWNATSGAGYPNNVTVTGNTTLNIINGATAYFKAAGALTVNTGSTFSIVNSTVGVGGVGVEFVGNIINDGTITLSGTTDKRLKGANFVNGNSNSTATTTLSSNGGGDLDITGNLTDNANFTANARAVFFTGTGVQTIGGTASGTFNVDYIVSNKASGSIQLLKDLLTGAPNGGNAITLTGATDIFDLNGFTYTLGTGGLASSLSGTGVFKGSSASKMIINGTGAFGTVRFDQTTPGTTNLLSNLTVNRTSAGGITLGNDLEVSTDLALTDGTITLGANNLTIGASGTITVSSPSATRMIVASGAGQLRKTYNATGSFVFPIGDATGTAEYSPATLNFTAGTLAGYAGVNVTNSKQTNNTSATDYINRYWTVTTSGITTPTCTATFTYLPADVAGTEANLYGGRYLASTWNCMGPVNTVAHTISSSITAFGDITAGELTVMGCCVNPTSGGVVAGSSSVCYGGDPAAFTSTSLPSGNAGTLQYQWQSSVTSPGTSGFSDISGATASTYDAPSGLTQTTWYKRTSKVTCSGTWASSGDSNTLQVSISSNVWNGGAATTAWGTAGNWSCGVPVAGSDVVISTASVYPEITTTETINSLTIDSGTTLIIRASHNLTVTNAIANAGTLTVENDANLNQVANVSNTGAGSTVVNRDTATLMRQDYVLWSSPISGQQLQAFSPQTLSTRFYTFDGSLGAAGQYVAETATNSFTTAQGYLIRLPNNHPTTPTVWNGVFTGGNANNGNVPLNGLNSNQYYAIGNPYPSVLDADLFIAGNSLTDAMYFWRKTNNSANPSYATYTLAGGVGTANSADPLGLTPNGDIAVGQGFIVKTASTSLSFTNMMRTIVNGSIFFRTNEVQKNRIWLNLSSTAGNFCQTLVSYMENATAAVDPMIDGPFINDTETALTSVINNQEFSIQGRALPFDAADTVPLGFKCIAAGDYTIGIDHVDGFFTTSEDIFVRDNLTNTVHDLRSSPYTFTTEAGTFNSRFDLIYQSALAVHQPTFTANNVVVYHQGAELVVNSGSVVMSKVQVYDIRGSLLVEKDNINASEVHLNAGTANQVLLVKITSSDRGTVTKKVVN